MRASDPTYPLFPVFSFLGFVLCAIPLTWHVQAWNVGTCGFMIWTGLACLITFCNSIIWAENALDVAPVWCDISSQIILGASIGIPASTLCISRRLYRILTTQAVSITRDDKIRAIYCDVGITVGFPVLMLVLHFIVQGHRFDILQEYGCTSVTYNTLPAYFLYYMWPIAIGLVSLVYSSLTLRFFYLRRIQFNLVLSSNGMISPSRYLRLMLLAFIDILCTIPIGVYTIYISLHDVPLAPWISWDNVHYDFGNVRLVPAVIWRSDPTTYTSVQITRWLPIVCAFVFFALFGFAEEAMKNYRRIFGFISRRLGLRPASEQGLKKKGGLFSGLKKLKGSSVDSELPVYVTPKDPLVLAVHVRKSILESDNHRISTATICFPDDGVELDEYQKSFMPLGSPSSSEDSSIPMTATTTTVTMGVSPPSYVDSIYLDNAALALTNARNALPRTPPPRPISHVVLNTDEHERHFQLFYPSSSSSSSSDEDEDDDISNISITDAYFDSRPNSLAELHPPHSHPPLPLPPAIPGRVPTTMPFMASEVEGEGEIQFPAPPPTAAVGMNMNSVTGSAIGGNMVGGVLPRRPPPPPVLRSFGLATRPRPLDTTNDGYIVPRNGEPF